MQHEMTTPGPLLDARGRLCEAGWARSPVKAYDRKAIRAGALRIKEWDYYCVLNDGFGAGFTIADNGYLGLISVTLFDLSAAVETSASAMPLFTLGSFKAPADSEAGDFCYEKKGLAVRFLRRPGQRVIEVDWPGFRSASRDGSARRAGLANTPSVLDGRRGLSGRIVLSQPAMDSMVIATPFKEKATAFYYNRKVNCMAASGSLDFGGQAIRFDPADSSAVLDWGRGVWTYSNTWYWASCSSRLEGKPFGFNLGYGFGDTGAATENMLFHEGRAHKLGGIEFVIPPDSFLKPWRIVGDDGRFDMAFTPILDRFSDTNLLLLRSTQHQVFGRYTGRAVLDSGRELRVENMVGFAEKVSNTW
jgi:hypothetical protein